MQERVALGIETWYTLVGLTFLKKLYDIKRFIIQRIIYHIPFNGKNIHSIGFDNDET